jgi:prolyl oligopeptidase
MNLIPVIDKPEASYEYVTNDGPITYLVTQKSAPNYRLVAIDIKNPKEVSFDFLSILKFKSYLYESLSLHYFRKK